jgi:hypothetical protein
MYVEVNLNYSISLHTDSLCNCGVFIAFILGIPFAFAFPFFSALPKRVERPWFVKAILKPDEVFGLRVDYLALKGRNSVSWGCSEPSTNIAVG